ncbi:hypothetical protein [Rhodopirellula baltica]|nr:hypothetical protein [Rhodopirellula baltica]
MTDSIQAIPDSNHQCKYCRAVIPEDASVCQICQRPQSVLLNRIGPIGTGVGILTFALAALTYVGGVVSTHLFSDASMRVVKITSDEPVVVNTGDYPILLEQILTEVPELDHKIQLSIDRVISKGTDNQAQRIETNGPVPVASYSSAFTFLRLTQEQIKSVRDAKSLDFHLLVLSVSSDEAKTILSEHPNATHFKGTAVVSATCWETGDRLSESVDVIAIPCYGEYDVPKDTKYELVNPPSFSPV